ncbi:MAG: hypothetical protein WCR55_04650 [Lentisphaerota bacterium]
MKKTIALIISFFSFCFMQINAYDTNDSTNDFYDNQPSVSLGTNDIYIDGEVENPGKVDLSALPLRAVVTKETLFKDGVPHFVGSYIYEGYSLYDILNKVKIKRTSGEFKSVVDLYVVIKNKSGESVVFSWGEIYYPTSRFNLIIATSVAPILPHAVDIKWPIPDKMKVIAGDDLITERNILAPETITIKSIKLDETQYSKKDSKGKLALFDNGKQLATITKFPISYKEYTYSTVFYGRGRGIHGIDPFTGVPLNYVLQQYYPLSNANIMNGIFEVISADNYRCAYTFSEIFNRNDQKDVLFLNTEGKDDGKFMLFPGADFFSDRAIKSLIEFRFKNEK